MRARNLWGWGFLDHFPDESARRALAARVCAVLGDGAATPRPLPPEGALALPDPRVQPPPALAGFASAEPAVRAAHAYGKAYRDQVRAFQGDFSGAPDFVATPRDEADVTALLEWATGARVTVVPFGGGTSVVGGVEPILGPGHVGAVSLDLGLLDRVLEIDPVSRAARIQAGATGPRLEEQLAGAGLTLRHFPQSFELSTLGGWIATRAGGHYATLYTHIDDLVESIRMLTPRGVYATLRLPASGAGPAPDRLVLGSEGTLGVITEAWVRVQKRPSFRASASARFGSFADAVAATRDIAQAGLHPANCRLLDPWEAMMNGVAGPGQSVLLVAFESADHPLDAWLERALAIAAGHGGEVERKRADGETQRGGPAGDWRRAFLEAPYLQSALISLGVIADTFETACTWSRFEELHGAISEAVRGAITRVCGRGVLTSRFTHVYPDGPAPYYTFIAPARSGGELEQWAELKRVASDTLAAHGATITHHHAVGRLHRPWYERECPELFRAALRAAKTTLDPGGILNPGVLIGP